MFHVYYPSFSFCQLNLHGNVNVMQTQVVCKKDDQVIFFSEKQSLLTVGKATIIQTGIAYTAVQTFSIVNKHVYLLKKRKPKKPVFG